MSGSTGTCNSQSYGEQEVMYEGIWPLLLVCQVSSAVHLKVMHYYSTVTFLLQWRRFVAIRGCPAVVVSDKGSKLTSKEN